MSTMLLRLAAPLQSWGCDAKFDRRSTERAPTKSGVIGLVAAAMGRRREEKVDDLAELHYGVRIDREGTPLRDYHTAKSKKSAYVTSRSYLSDAVFLVGLEGKDALLHEIERAICRPAFPLYLGRRSCPPEGQLFIGIRERTLYDALISEPCLAQRRPVKGENNVCSLRLLMDDGAGIPSFFHRDIPISFDQRHRRYGFRPVCDTVVPVLSGSDEPTTEHDPFSEMEV